MHSSHLTTPPNSIRRSEDTHDSSDESGQSLPPNSPPEFDSSPPDSPPKSNSSPPDSGPHLKKQHYIIAQFKPLEPNHQRSEPTIIESEHEIHALPCPPPIMSCLSHLVKYAHTKFKPYERHHSFVPSALELHFTERSVGKYSGEADMSLADIEAMSNKAIHKVVITKQAARESKHLCALTTAWELEAPLQDTQLLEMFLEQDAQEYADSMEFKVEMDFNIGAYGQDLTFFAVANLQLDYIKSLVHKLCLHEGVIIAAKGNLLESNC
ncbi:hypothetical protein DFH29DRAFT_879304 [Suillus ampliporus]|nr:hypothetical protein DFH29DRAFT_879304 [Suillus ampliporus]